MAVVVVVGEQNRRNVVAVVEMEFEVAAVFLVGRR